MASTYLFCKYQYYNYVRKRTGKKIQGSRAGGLNPTSSKKKMRKSQRRSSPSDIPPAAGGETDTAAMMELILDMLSQMHAMEEYVAQWEQAVLDQPQRDDAVRRSSPRLAARHEGRGLDKP